MGLTIELKDYFLLAFVVTFWEYSRVTSSSPATIPRKYAKRAVQMMNVS
jgi:hypothetical protein